MAAYLAKILRSEVRAWPNGSAIVVVLHKHSPSETKMLESLLNMNDAQWRTLLADHKDSFRVANSDSGVIKTVASIPGGIGFVAPDSVNQTVNVIHVDNKLSNDPDYPLQ
jgi:ABC-type phosphate transport system substrate-binding protein